MKVKDLINELEEYDPELELDDWDNDLPEDFVKTVKTRYFDKKRYVYASLFYYGGLHIEKLFEGIEELSEVIENREYSPTYLAKNATYTEFVKRVRIGDDYTYCVSAEDDSLDKRLDYVLYLTEKKRELAIR